ncbi:hypothetical protein Tco_1102435 [Tanacetum coccineum]
MNSPPNDQWELSLDIDDSDLRLTSVLRPCNNIRVKNLPQPKTLMKVVEDVGEEGDFNCGSRVNMVEFMNANEGVVSGCLGDIKKNLKNEKLDQVVAIIKSCAPDALGDLIVALKDLSEFYPKPSMHYLTITMRNLVKVFHKDAIPRNGRGVGGNVIDQREHQDRLNQEALILALEEEAREARVEQKWQDKCRQEQDLEEEHEILLLGFYV